jgi:hypothetical protein
VRDAKGGRNDTGHSSFEAVLGGCALATHTHPFPYRRNMPATEAVTIRCYPPFPFRFSMHAATSVPSIKITHPQKAVTLL